MSIKQRGLEDLTYDGVTAEDIVAFCKGAKLQFLHLGTESNFDETESFQVVPDEMFSNSFAIRLDKVIEWKAAVAEMGAEKTTDGVYRNYLGELFNTVCEAHDAQNDVKVVVYRNKAGDFFTLPKSEFFRIVSHNDKLYPRFKEDVEMTPISDDELDKLIGIVEFRELENQNAIGCDDGSGYWATATEVSALSLYGNTEQPSWATHVMWYSR